MSIRPCPGGVGTSLRGGMCMASFSATWGALMALVFGCFSPTPLAFGRFSPTHPNCCAPWMGSGKPQRRRDDNKNKIFTFEGGGLGGREENRPKTFVFVGNATTMKFWGAQFIVEKFCCHGAGSSNPPGKPFKHLPVFFFIIEWLGVPVHSEEPPWRSSRNTVWRYRNGPCGGGICGPCAVGVSCCLYFQCLANELVLAVSKNVSKTVVRWFWDNCQNQWFRKAFAFEMQKRILATSRWKKGSSIFWGSRAHKMPRKLVFLFAHFYFGCFRVWRPLLQLGVMKLFVLELLRHLFWGVSSGFRVFGKCIQIPWFVVYYSSLPLWGWGKFGGKTRMLPCARKGCG